MTERQLKEKINKWKDSIKGDITPTLSSFVVEAKIPRSTINTWKNTKPELYELYKTMVFDWVQYKVEQKLVNSEKPPIGLMFYAKAALGIRENGNDKNNIEPISVVISLANTGQHTLTKKGEANGDSN